MPGAGAGVAGNRAGKQGNRTGGKATGRAAKQQDGRRSNRTGGEATRTGLEDNRMGRQSNRTGGEATGQGRQEAERGDRTIGQGRDRAAWDGIGQHGTTAMAWEYSSKLGSGAATTQMTHGKRTGHQERRDGIGWLQATSFRSVKCGSLCTATRPLPLPPLPSPPDRAPISAFVRIFGSLRCGCLPGSLPVSAGKSSEARRLLGSVPASESDGLAGRETV